jgi:hypothetical protein
VSNPVLLPVATHANRFVCFTGKGGAAGGGRRLRPHTAHQPPTNHQPTTNHQLCFFFSFF